MKHKGLLFPVLFMMFIFISSLSAAELVLQPDGTAGKDAEINTYYPTTNFGSANHLTQYYGSSYLDHGLIGFDISAIPSEATINSATLELLENQNCSTNQNTIEAHLNSGLWDEATVTWNTAPAYGPSIVTNTGETFSCDWLIFDVTSAVQSWFSGNSQNYGFRITGPAGDNLIKFLRSSDYTIPGERPILRINYSTGPQSIPTLNEWGMIAFMLLTGISAIYYLRKNHLSA